jgi:hypothetical protein
MRSAVRATTMLLLALIVLTTGTALAAADHQPLIVPAASAEHGVAPTLLAAPQTSSEHTFPADSGPPLAAPTTSSEHGGGVASPFAGADTRRASGIGWISIASGAFAVAAFIALAGMTARRIGWRRRVLG